MVDTLEIYVTDTVSFGEPFTAPDAVPVATPYFKPEYTFTVPKDVSWAPARSRAPSVEIGFEFLGEMTF